MKWKMLCGVINCAEINKYISTNIQLSVQKIITASIRVLHLLSAQSLQMILQICIVYPISDEQ